MAQIMPVTEESAHQFGDNPQLTGIVTRPGGRNGAVCDTGIIILSSGLLHRVGPFRLHVDLARSLANAGFVVMRVDQSGRGDSNRSTGHTTEQTIQEEYSQIAGFLEEVQSLRRFVVIGLCSGADDALALAPGNESIAGLVLMDGFAARNPTYYVRYYLARLLDPRRVGRALFQRIKHLVQKTSASDRSDISELGDLAGIRNFPAAGQAKQAFNDLFERDGRAFCAFTGGVEDYYSFDGQLRSNLGLASGDDCLHEVYYPDANHTYPISSHRAQLVEDVVTWCGAHFR